MLPPDIAPGIEFHLSPGDWIRLLRTNGFEIEDLVEVYPTEGSPAQCSLAPFAPLEWARQWPTEEVWKVRERG